MWSAKAGAAHSESSTPSGAYLIVLVMIFPLV
jgi:hypothetical protein